MKLKLASFFFCMTLVILLPGCKDFFHSGDSVADETTDDSSTSVDNMDEVILSGYLTLTEGDDDGDTYSCAFILSTSDTTVSGDCFLWGYQMPFTSDNDLGSLTNLELAMGKGTMSGTAALVMEDGSYTLNGSVGVDGIVMSFNLEEADLDIIEFTNSITTTASGSRVGYPTYTEEEFVIGSSEIYAYSYRDGHFLTPSYLGDDEGDKILRDIYSLTFSSDSSETYILAPQNVPETMNILYFDTEGMAVYVSDDDGGSYSWYGNTNDVDNAENWAEIYDADSSEYQNKFNSLGIIFIDKNIMPESMMIGSLLHSDSGISDATVYSGNSDYKAAALQVCNEVGYSEGKMLFIPMDPIDSSAIDEINLSVDMDNLILYVDTSTDPDSVQYSLDSDGSPITCTLSTN